MSLPAWIFCLMAVGDAALVALIILIVALWHTPVGPKF